MSFSTQIRTARRALILAAVLVTTLAHPLPAQEMAAIVQPLCPPGGLCGALVLVPDDRFDPLVQNMLAKQELARLPKDYRPLFLILPAPADSGLAEHQIRFLHQLLEQADQK